MLKRVAPGLRPAATACAASHPYLEDLLLSFPLALAAIASRSQGHEAASALVRAGAPLKSVAQALSMPMWLRRVPVEASTCRPLPALPLSQEFALSIRSLLPRSGPDAARWISGVAAAYATCDEDFAIWIARRFKENPNIEAEGVAALAVFVWFARRPDLEASEFMQTPFAVGMSRDEAIDAAYAWLDQLSFAVLRAPYNAIDGPRTEVDGLAFVPLATPRDFADEAAAMSNCLASYWDVTARGSNQVWGIRRAGERIASVEIAITNASRGTPELRQVRGPKNADVGDAVLRAVYAWLLGWPDDLDNLALRWRHGTADRAIYARLMKPYWKAKGCAQSIPYTPPSCCGPFDPLAAALGRFVSRNRGRRARRRGGL